MKKLRLMCLFVFMLLLVACTQVPEESVTSVNEIKIELNDEKVVSESDAVHIANDIVYYEAGKDATYGEGTEKDAHSADDAAAHTVVHITEPGTYRLSGKLSLGQIAVDLGEDAEENPEAVVTLILDGVDITCEVAPAVIFYNVYECEDKETATKDVDTSKAGANVIIADGTTNTINGSYVEKIYKPGTEDKLHKYDGAFYSRMSMNVNGEEEGSGILNIQSDNEGLDSELHLTINGGNINIHSGNDGINTNEDGVSVTTVNGGTLTIKVTGETGEGDGIDSNGWLVINGGKVIAAACSDSADAGIDSDMGIHINGGTVIASGHMLDRIEEGGQTYAVFNFAKKQAGAETVYLKDANENNVLEICPENAYSVLVYSSADLKEGNYTLWNNDEQLAGGMGMQGMPGMKPEDGEPPERPEESEGQEPPQKPEGFEGQEPPERPEGVGGQEPPKKPGESMGDFTTEITTKFQIKDGGNMFSVSQDSGV